MSEFVAPDGVTPRDLRRAAAAPRSPPRSARRSSAQIPIEPAVSQGGDDGPPGRARPRPTARPARAFHALADRIVDELLPPIEMAGCTARLLDLLPGAAQPTGA